MPRSAESSLPSVSRMFARVVLFLAAFLPLVAIAAAPVPAGGGTKAADPAVAARVRAQHLVLPLAFEAREDGRAYFARGRGYSLGLTPGEAVLALSAGRPEATPDPMAERHPRHHRETAAATSAAGAEATPARQAALRIRLVGANTEAALTAEDRLPGTVNYFLGNDPAKWRSGIATYAKVRYREVYPGIDLVYYGNQGQLEYDFVVAPGADPDRIEMDISGADSVDTAPDGALVLKVTGGELRMKKPLVYQEIDGERRPVAGQYELRREGESQRVAFTVAGHDPTRALVIDPVVVYSTYLGGIGNESGFGIAVDASGNAYVTGTTSSKNFPTSNAFDPTYTGLGDAYVVKLSPDGRSLLYATYLGGTIGDEAYGIAVDSSGNAYVTGWTQSTDFPTLNAFDPTLSSLSGTADAFVVKLSPDGRSLLYATYLGGTEADWAYGIALDSSGNAYVTGFTHSTDFPTLNAFDPSLSGFYDAFVVKLSPDGRSLLYATYLGGTSYDYAYGIAVDSSGNAYVTGCTYSTDFPTLNAFDPTGGMTDAFVVKLSPDGRSLLYATYLGGTSQDWAYGIAVDSSGNAYVTGWTGSANFPTSNAFDPSLSGLDDAFVVKLSPDGRSLLYATYLGGTFNDEAHGIAVDSSGNAYVTGFTQSSDFPTSNAFDPSLSGAQDAFVVKLSPDGRSLLYATYLGGTSGDDALGIAVDSSGNAYVTGDTSSTDFPTSNALYPEWLGAGDAFITKFASDPVGPFTFSGLIYDRDTLQPIVAAQVQLGTVSGATDTTGRFLLLGLDDQYLALSVSRTGYQSFTTTLNPAITPTRDLWLVFDAAACPATGTVSGTVLDATTNQVVIGATLTLDGVTVQSGADGRYSFSAVPAGSRDIAASALHFAPAGVPVNVCGDTVRDVPLAAASTVDGLTAPSGYSADPVNTATGNYTLARTDISLPGKGLGFRFERGYNSQDGAAGRTGPLGYGWTHNFNTGLTEDALGNATIRYGDGRTVTFTLSGGVYTPQYGVFDTLVKNADGSFDLTRKDLVRLHFGADGKLATVSDRNGNIQTLTYTDGKLTRVSDTAGRAISFAYDAQARIIRINFPPLRTVKFTYDAAGNLASALDAKGQATVYTYDADHQMLTATDPRGNVFVTNTYDADRRVVTAQRDAKGGQTTYVYDTTNNITTFTNPLGQVQVHWHDSLLRLIQEQDALGQVRRYVYDAAGNRVAVTDRNGNPTSYAYDAAGNVTVKTDALGKRTELSYDAYNNPLTRTDALGGITTFSYDGLGNLIQTTDALGHTATTTYDAAGLPLTVTDARGNVTTYTYDARGNLLTETNALGQVTAYAYDAAGRRLSRTDPLGRVTRYAYDANDNLTTVTDAFGNTVTTEYDGNDNVVSVTDKLGHTVTTAYDVKDLPTTVTDPLGARVVTAYDALDRRTEVTDKRGNRTRYAYDAAGRLSQITDALGGVTAFDHDPEGNRTGVTDPLGQRTAFAYDALNRRTRVTDPLGNATVTAYDAVGRVSSVTDAKGQVTTYTYDAVGHPVDVQDARGGHVAYTYDAAGNRIAVTDPRGNVTAYEYDALNRVITRTEPGGRITRYAYDAVGNRIQLTKPDATVIQYAFDKLDRLTTITYPDASKVSFTYDAKGQRLSMTDANGRASYAYDSLGRLVRQTDAFGKAVDYAYDVAGNLIGLTYPDGKRVNYLFDDLNRLVSVTDWGNRTTSYTYDAAGRVIDAILPNATRTAHAYDGAGRLTQLAHRVAGQSFAAYSQTLDALGDATQVTATEPLIPVLAAESTSYTYDADNRLTQVGSTPQTFDANGNLLTKGTDSFVWDFDDRLRQATVAGSVTGYQYDGVGNRVARTAGGITTRYVLDANRRLPRVLAETDASGNITAYYIHGLGLVERIGADGSVRFYHHDVRGSTVALTSLVGAITDKYAYDAFGKLADSFGTNPNPFRYVGRYGLMDEGNGLLFARARYYDSDTGRFLSKDPLPGAEGDTQALHRYVYAVNNPIRLVDVSGLSPLEGGRLTAEEKRRLQVLQQYYLEQYLSSLQVQDTWLGIGQSLAKFTLKKESKYAIELVLGALINANGFNQLGDAAFAVYPAVGPLADYGFNFYDALRDIKAHPQRSLEEAMGRFFTDTTSSALQGAAVVGVTAALATVSAPAVVTAGAAVGVGVGLSVGYGMVREDVQDWVVEDVGGFFGGSWYETCHDSWCSFGLF